MSSFHNKFSFHDCDLTINGKNYTKLVISQYYEKHNLEYEVKMKKKGLLVDKKIVTDELIIQFLIQLQKEERIELDEIKRPWTYYNYQPLFNDEGRPYFLTWCINENDSNFLGVVNCFPSRKHDNR